MWVYWLTLGSLSVVLYFPYKKFLSRSVALRASIATFLISMVYPLLLVKLSVVQTVFSLALLLLFLGAAISKNHPSWEAEEPEETGQTDLPPDAAGAELTDLRAAEMEAITGRKPLKTAEPPVANPNIPEDSPAAAMLQIEEAPAETAVEVVIEENAPRENSVPAVVLEGPDLSEDSAEPVEMADLVSEQTRTQENAAQADSLSAITPVEQDLSEDVSELVEIADPASVETRSLEDNPPEDNLPVEIPRETEPVPDGSLSPQSLLVEGLCLTKRKQYAQAVRYFNKVIASEPEPELIYMAVSELSSLYQHLGLYPMASEIIIAFAEHPALKEHPGMANLKQKARFIRYLVDLLNRDGYGHIPYQEVPEAVRREAFDNSLNINHLIS